MTLNTIYLPKPKNKYGFPMIIHVPKPKENKVSFLNKKRRK